MMQPKTFLHTVPHHHSGLGVPQHLRRVVSVFVLLFPRTLLAQQPSLLWTGEVRARSEVDMRDFNLRTAANTYTLLRTRLGLEVRPLSDVRVFIQAQDSRSFGQERDATGSFNTLADSRNLDLHQGFLEVSNLFADSLSLRLGRQELVYGNERLIGAVGWNNVGRAFDGGLIRFTRQSFSLDLFAMNTGEVQPYAAVATPASVQYVQDTGQDLYGAYATFKSIPGNRLDTYVLYQWNRDTTSPGHSALNRYTLGSYVKGKSDMVDYEGEVAYQGGRRRGVNISAYMLTGALGYSFAQSIKRIGIGYDLLSGTPAGDAGYKSFDPLYHTGHKFYGFMDYFVNIPDQTAGLGIQDLYGKLTVALSDKTTLSGWLHNFAYARRTAGLRALGQELEFVTQYRYNTSVNFEAGASVFVPARLMRQRFGHADAGLWGFLQTSVAF